MHAGGQGFDSPHLHHFRHDSVTEAASDGGFFRCRKSQSDSLPFRSFGSRPQMLASQTLLRNGGKELSWPQRGTSGGKRWINLIPTSRCSRSTSRSIIGPRGNHPGLSVGTTRSWACSLDGSEKTDRPRRSVISMNIRSDGSSSISRTSQGSKVRCPPTPSPTVCGHLRHSLLG